MNMELKKKKIKKNVCFVIYYDFKVTNQIINAEADNGS